MNAIVSARALEIEILQIKIKAIKLSLFAFLILATPTILILHNPPETTDAVPVDIGVESGQTGS